MREISLHILDILQNSIAAGATRVVTRVAVRDEEDSLAIRIEDNGRGMTPEFVAKVLDPWVTTRTTRKIGLGIPMLYAAAEACGGAILIDSELGRGTNIEASFRLRHVDRAPFGDIVSTMVNTIVSNPEISFRFEQEVGGKEFVLDTNEIKLQLDGIPINDPLVVPWLRAYMEDGLSLAGKID